MLVHRVPHSALAGQVERIWFSAGERSSEELRPHRERSLPTGCANLVVRLCDEAIRVFRDVDDEQGTTHGHAVICGTRKRYHVRDTSRPSRTLGVHFRPGGAAALLGIPADQLAGRHTPLEDVWGREAERLRARLLEAPSAAEAMALMEEVLLARLENLAPPHAAIRQALARLEARPAGTSIESLRRESGLSHRRFVELFRRSVGLAPKTLARVLRFQAVLRRATAARRPGWAALALASGYCDQSHLSREFQELAGIPPGEYRPLSAARPNHVPLLALPTRRGATDGKKPPGRPRDQR